MTTREVPPLPIPVPCIMDVSHRTSGPGDTSCINPPNNPVSMALAPQLQETAVKQGVTAHTCRRSTGEAEAGE